MLAVVALATLLIPRNSDGVDFQFADQSVLKSPLIVFVVRHAEKVDESQDSDLSPVGAQRANTISTMLRDCAIEHVHSTDFKRTRRTAAPTANKMNLDVKLYDASDSSALAERMKTIRGRHLVVGHSNTVPELVKLLGGDPGTDIGKNEYDRLYIVSVGKDETTTLLMRFGAQAKSGK